MAFFGVIKGAPYSLSTEPDLHYDFHSGTERDTTTTLEGGVKMIYSSTHQSSIISEQN